MMESDKIIEQLQRLGTITVVPNTIPTEDLKKVADFVMAAKEAGHAMVVDETFEGKIRVVRVHHYLSCTVCQREAQDG